MDRIYACIDLKSFYASVECVERNLDPLTTNLVVADQSRTEKTICLAVTPSLKQYGLGGRSRLYEVVQKVKKINMERKKETSKFIGKSVNDTELKQNKNLELSYIVAPPRMSHYMKYSANIYSIYLKYISKEDMFSYSIDEVFFDITDYLNLYKATPKELVTKMIKDVYETTGITATAGIGTNLYLAKIAMDIEAKHCKPNEFGVRVAQLDEKTYKEKLWSHRPITDFWRIGKGTAKKLEQNGMYTMADIARMSINNEDFLFKLFGVNAELLIDHAWGYEPCTLEAVKKYKPATNSLSSQQVLSTPYDYKKARLIVREMTELLVLNIVEKRLVTNQIILHVGYDIENLTNMKYKKYCTSEIVKDSYGRSVPKPAHGTINLDFKTSSSKIITEKALNLFDKIINNKLLIKRFSISFNNLTSEKIENTKVKFEQFDIFTNFDEVLKKKEEEKELLKEENNLQHALIKIKNKYGKNSILKAMNLESSSTAIERNKQVGGHSE